MMAKYDSPNSTDKYNVYINGKRTSVLVETYVWEDMLKIATDEGMTMDQVCTLIKEHKHASVSMPSAIRMVLVEVLKAKLPKLRAGTRHPEMAEDTKPFPSPLFVGLEKLKSFKR